MTWSELQRIVGDNWVGLIMAGYVVVLCIIKLAEAKAGFAALLGPLGTLIKRFREAREKRAQQERVEDVEQLVVRMKGELLPPDYEALKSQVKTLSHDMSVLRHSNGALHAFVLYDEDWHFRQSREDAQNGRIGLARQSYDQFLMEYLTQYPVPRREARRVNGNGPT